MNATRKKELLLLALPPILLIALPESFWVFYLRLLLLLIGIVLVALGTIFLSTKKIKQRNERFFLLLSSRTFLLLLYSFSLTGVAIFRWEKRNPYLPTTPNQIHCLYGELEQFPSRGRDRIQFRLHLSGANFVSETDVPCFGSAGGVINLSFNEKEKYLQFEANDYENWVVGESLIVRVKGKMENFSLPHREPFLVLGVDRDCNRTKKLLNRKVLQVRGSLVHWYRFIERQELEREKKRGEEKRLSSFAGLVLALLDGERAFVDEGVKRAYANAGVSHLLALSGMHLGMIALLLLVFFKPLLGHKKALVVVLGFSFFYLFVAGASPSLMRSFIMMGFLCLFRLKGGGISMLLVLLLSLPLSLAIQPQSIQSPALILSYLALAGLLILDPLVQKWFLPFFPSRFVKGISASLSAQMATAWWTFPTFGFFSTGGIGAAFFLTPLTFLVMGAGSISFFLFLCGAKTLSFFCFNLAFPFYEINRQLLIFFSIWPTVKSWGALFLYFLPFFIVGGSLFCWYRLNSFFILRANKSCFFL